MSDDGLVNGLGRFQGALVDAARESGLPVVAAGRPAPELTAPIDWPRPPAALVLLGYDGAPTLWRAFSNSPEFADGAAHPLDRWSRRIGEALAQRFEATPLFPFGGPPHQPIFSWALAIDRVWPSPLGMLIGEERGLWVGYRAALAFDAAPEPHILAPLEPPAASAARPCDSCADQPCRTACPVDAFRPEGYDVDACAAHLERPEGADCRELGCRARRACPVVPPMEADQAAFHLAAFRAARRRAARARETE